MLLRRLFSKEYRRAERDKPIKILTDNRPRTIPVRQGLWRLGNIGAWSEKTKLGPSERLVEEMYRPRDSGKRRRIGGPEAVGNFTRELSLKGPENTEGQEEGRTNEVSLVITSLMPKTNP